MDAIKHIGWQVVVIFIVIAAIWAYINASNRANIEKLAPGASHTESTYHASPFTINIGQGSCQRIQQPDDISRPQKK